MGRAERLKGKTLEDRIQFAQRREWERLKAIKDREDLIAEQEILAWKTMVWWQIEMTTERYELLERIKYRRRAKTAVIGAVMAAGIGALIPHNPINTRRFI